MNSTKKAVKAVNVVEENTTIENLKNIRNSISGLIGISKKENEVQLSRRAESLKLFKFLGVTVDDKTGVDENPYVKSMAVMAEKFPKTHKAIKKTMFKEWCSLVDSKGNKGAEIKNGNAVINGNTIAINFENLFGDEKKIKALKESMKTNPALHAWVILETDEGNGTGIKVQYKKWENKEYNKIKNSLKPESNTGTGSSAVTPANFYDKKIASPLGKILDLFKKEQGKRFHLTTVELLNSNVASLEKALKESLDNDVVYQSFLKGDKIS